MRLIDADELKELFPDNGEGSWTYNITAKMYIDNAPTIEWKDIELMGYVNGEQITKIKPSKIEGHWEKITYKDGTYYSHHECSICSFEVKAGHSYEPWFNYCPNCGARMNP